MMQGIPKSERVIIGTDFNGHVGEGNKGDERVMGRYGIKDRNAEGQMIIDFAKSGVTYCTRKAKIIGDLQQWRKGTRLTAFYADVAT